MNVDSKRWVCVSRIGTTGSHRYIGEISIDIFCGDEDDGEVRLYDVLNDKELFGSLLCMGYHRIRKQVRKFGVFELQVKGKCINFRGFETDDLTSSRGSRLER